MARMNWAKARKRTEGESAWRARKLDWKADSILGRDAQKQRAAAPSKPRSAPPRAYQYHFPAVVTLATSGNLTTITLHSRTEADESGFVWVGRRSSAP